MVTAALTLSLLGLGAVNALPTTNNVKERQLVGGGGSVIITPAPGTGDGPIELPTCSITIPINQQPPCIFSPLPGEFLPPMPPMPPKGKRDFVLPPDYKTNTKAVIKQLEVQLVSLQNKKVKTQEDLTDIAAIKAALKYLANITSISAPPGSGTIFIPGKRDVEAAGAYAAQCPELSAAEAAIKKLLSKKNLTLEERMLINSLRAFLVGCGAIVSTSPDGSIIIIRPGGKKREEESPELVVEAPAPVDAGFSLTGLEEAYKALYAAYEGAESRPSFTSWLALQQMADLLDLYGKPVQQLISRAETEAPTPIERRQIGIIGGGACEPADVMGLRAALIALLVAYGHPSQAPANIFLVEQVLVSALQICGAGPAGWTVIIPGTPVPGPMVPEVPTPGAPMIPEITVPGGPMVPEVPSAGAPMKPAPRSEKEDVMVEARQTLIAGDPAAILAALKLLEQKYGGYGSGTIPAPVFLIMVNMVTILQESGVKVPGWPVLGQGSVSFGSP